MTDREEFEKWAEQNVGFVERRIDGGYCDHDTQAAWIAWQASRHAALEEAAKHVETLALVFFFGEREFAKTGRSCTADAIRALATGGEK